MHYKEINSQKVGTAKIFLWGEDKLLNSLEKTLLELNFEPRKSKKTLKNVYTFIGIDVLVTDLDYTIDLGSRLKRFCLDLPKRKLIFNSDSIFDTDIIKDMSKKLEEKGYDVYAIKYSFVENGMIYASSSIREIIQKCKNPSKDL